MKILVVDDHVLIRESLRGVLVELRPEAAIVEATDARETMRLVASHPDDIALVPLDLNLPDRDAFLLLTELRHRHPTITIAALAGHHAPATVKRAHDAAT